MKPITVLAVSFLGLVMCACATPAANPRVAVKNIGSLSPAERDAVNALPIYNETQLAGKNYTILAMVEGISCQHFNTDPPATKLDAVNQAKYWAKELGANAAVNIQCDPPRGVSAGYDCWESVTCTAQAVRLSQK